MTRDEMIAQALELLKAAGLNVSVNGASSDPPVPLSAAETATRAAASSHAADSATEKAKAEAAAADRMRSMPETNGMYIQPRKRPDFVLLRCRCGLRSSGRQGDVFVCPACAGQKRAAGG